MKWSYFTFFCAFGLTCIGHMIAAPLAQAEEARTVDASIAKTEIRKEIARLVRQDAQAMKDSSKTTSPEETDYNPDDTVVVLETFVTRGSKAQVIPPPLRESSAQKFFRSGTIMENVGKKVTTRFWARGDRGLMLSFSR